MLIAPVVRERKGEHVQVFEQLRAQGFVRARVDGRVHELDALPPLALRQKHTIEAVIDRFRPKRRPQAAPGRIVRDRAPPRRGHRRAGRPRRRAGKPKWRGRGTRGSGRRQGGRDHVLVALFVPGLRLLVAGTRTAPVLVQLAGRRLPGLRRPGRDPVLRPGARGGPSAAQPRRRCGTRLGPAQSVLLPADPVAGQALPVRRRHALARPARGDPPSRAVRLRRHADQLPLRDRCEWRGHPQTRVRGHRAEPRTALSGNRVASGARGTGQVHQRPRLPRMPRPAPQPQRAQRVRRRCQPAQPDRAADRPFPGVLRPARTGRLARRDRGQDRQGDSRAPALPGRRRPRLPHPRPPGRFAVRRRGAAHPLGFADRRRSGRRDVRARRALDRPAPARQRTPARHAAAPARPRQHGDRGRARRGRDPPRRPHRRHRPRRRRARRRGGRRGRHRGDPRLGAFADRAIPVGSAQHRGAGATSPTRPGAHAEAARRLRQQPQGRRPRNSGRPVRLRDRRVRIGQIHPDQRHPATPRRRRTQRRQRETGAVPRGAGPGTVRQDRRHRPVTDRAHAA